MFARLVLLALIGSCFSSSLQEVFSENDLEISFKEGLENYFKTGERSYQFERALEAFQLPRLFRREDNEEFKDESPCTVCQIAISTVIAVRRMGIPKKIITTALTELCARLGIEERDVCEGAIESNADTMLYIVDNKKDLTTERICSILMQEFGCIDSDRKDWTIQVPPVIQQNVTRNEKETITPEKPFKVLHLTDIHYDPKYEVDSDANCGKPLCCQQGSKPKAAEDAAGYWGDYRGCDTPRHAVVDGLDHIVSQHRDLDYIYFTGDIINHKVWDTDTEGNKKAIKDIFKMFKGSFGNVPIYPILGNHEPHPVNLYSYETVKNHELSTEWIFKLSAEEWGRWLPESTRETILKGGYYSVLVKPGFRIIALNSNVCYNYNWWLLYDDYDPFDQLKWLVETLAEAERTGEKVHILSHVPSGVSGCLINWGKEYSNIISRFSHTISAQFLGHTHYDDVVLYFENDNLDSAVNVAFNGGSLTTYSNRNPNYKIYNVDPKSLNVLDFETWMFSITKSNENLRALPIWTKLYSFKQAYNVPDLSPKELAKLTERIAKSHELREQYFRFKFREADTTIAKGCDEKCQIKNLCTMVTSIYGNNVHCEILTEIYNSNKHPVNNSVLIN